MSAEMYVVQIGDDWSSVTMQILASSPQGARDYAARAFAADRRRGACPSVNLNTLFWGVTRLGTDTLLDAWDPATKKVITAGAVPA